MPVRTIPISINGPIIEVYVGVSAPRRAALIAAGLPLPNPVQARCLIDTGASGTALDPAIISALQLTPSGCTMIATPSTGATLHRCNQYDVLLYLPFGNGPTVQIHSFGLTLPVFESSLLHAGIAGLIGRDILSQCVLGYNGPEGHIFIAV